MALSDLTFKLYTDSGLTSLYTGTTTTTHETDLSDGAQDFQLWFGSTNSARTLEATSNPGVDNITLTPTDNIDGWLVATAYVVGDIIEPSTPNTFAYTCTTAGTSHASTEPTWPTSGIGSTVADNTVIWTLRGKKHPTTEIKVASTAAGLPGATGGVALSLGTSITGGSGNAVEVNIRVTNTVATVSDTSASFDLVLAINAVQETE